MGSRVLTALATTIVTMVLGYHAFVQEPKVTLEGVKDIEAATANFEDAAAEIGAASEKAAETMKEGAKAFEAAMAKSAEELRKAAAPPEKPAPPAAADVPPDGGAPPAAPGLTPQRAKPARIEPLPPGDHPAPASAPGSRGFAYGVAQGVFTERDADRTQRSRSADGELRDTFWQTGDDIAVRIVLDVREVNTEHILEHGNFASPEEALRAVREQALMTPHVLHVILKPPAGTASAGVPEYSLLHDERAPALFWLQTVLQKRVRPDVLTAPDGAKVLGYAYRFRARLQGSTVEFLAPGRHTVRPAGGWTSSLLEVEAARR